MHKLNLICGEPAPPHGRFECTMEPGHGGDIHDCEEFTWPVRWRADKYEKS